MNLRLAQINLRYGVIEIDGDIISRSYTLHDFNKTHPDKAVSTQIKCRHDIKLDSIVHLFNSRFIATMLFTESGRLYSLNLMCIDIDFDFIDEIKRKQLHDKILNDNGYNTENYYNWGSIKSVYDKRGNVSSIIIQYNNNKDT